MSAARNNRLDARFEALKADGRAGLVCFVTAGDPDVDRSQAILDGLAEAGADIIELGMPFSDPMADGPSIQASSMRALAAGQTMKRTLAMLARFRRRDTATPVVLMGYYNPIYSYGAEAFCRDAAAAGADGLIVVDLPPEEDAELRRPAGVAGLHNVRLATPTTDTRRLPRVLEGAGGFLYYVSITGVTGSAALDVAAVQAHLAEIRRATALPIGVGFGIRRPDQAAAVASFADAVVVGSALVEAAPKGAAAVLGLVRELARGVRDGRRA